MTKRFVPPTIEECGAYNAQENHYLVNVAVFWNHYETVDWKVGRNGKMSSWHSAMAGWQARKEAKRGIKPSHKCLVCKQPGFTTQLNKKNKQLWLCKNCEWYIKVAGYEKTWGWLSKAEIERKVQEGKAKLRH